MKKSIIISLLSWEKSFRTLFVSAILFGSVSATAQLRVYSTGNIAVKEDINASNVTFNVGTANMGSFTSYRHGILDSEGLQSGKYNIAVMGNAVNTEVLNSGRAFGLKGHAGNATTGYNYGVFGYLSGSQNGASICGELDNVLGVQLQGRYAGYFNGATYVNGTLTATTLITPSDIRLKENISSLSEDNAHSTLDNVMDMNVISYNYIARSQEPVGDTAVIAVENKGTEKTLSQKHFGLSAQELQNIYPELVTEGQDGFLGVNYVELVPILIRSIQELKQELDAVKGSGARMTRSAFSGDEDEMSTSASQNMLYQNTPNPFKEQTTIRFSLADDVTDAAICIFDMTGKMLKKLPVSSGETSVKVNGWELGEGMFLYTLMVNGQEMDTKKMIITR